MQDGSTASTPAARPAAARPCLEEEGRPSRPLLSAPNVSSGRAARPSFIECGVVQGVIASRAGTCELAARAAPTLGPRRAAEMEKEKQ